MIGVAELNREEDWDGGFYELALELGPTDDGRLERALIAIWQEAGVGGCFAVAQPSPLEHVPISLSLAALDLSGHIRGALRLPTGIEVVCGAYATRFEKGSDWLNLYVPMGSLVSTDRRIGSFPIGDDGGPVSLRWRRPIDEWLAGVAARVYEEARFLLAMVGFEAAGESDADSLARGIPEERYFAYLLPANGGLKYHEANR